MDLSMADGSCVRKFAVACRVLRTVTGASDTILLSASAFTNDFQRMAFRFDRLIKRSGAITSDINSFMTNMQT